MGRELCLYMVYRSPDDYPGMYIARKFLINEMLVATSDVYYGLTLQSVRDQLPKGLIRLPRSPDDAITVVELWMQEYDLSI
jgi:hypothetical protein